MQISHWRAGEEYGNSSPRVKFRIHKSQVFSIPNYTNSPGKTSPRDVHSALEFSKQLLASKGENKGRKKQDTLRGEREEKKRAALTSNDIARLSRLTRALNNLPPAGRAYETRREDRAQVWNGVSASRRPRTCAATYIRGPNSSHRPGENSIKTDLRARFMKTVRFSG